MKSPIGFRVVSVFLTLVSVFEVFGSAGIQAGRDSVYQVDRVVVVPESGETNHQIAEVLKHRILKRSQVKVTIGEAKTGAGSATPALLIRLGRTNPTLNQVCEEWGIEPPTTESPGPEGFVIACQDTPEVVEVLAVGTDRRGTLYAVGEILRRLTYLPKALEITPFQIRTAPAFRWRGSSANQGGTMMGITGARSWSTEERREVVLDYALAGANTFYAGGSEIDWLKSFDLQVEAGCRPNQLPGTHPEWRRKGTEPGEYVCPSIPEARQELLRHWEAVFKNMGDRDVLRFFAGDPGGCRCDLCMPWGKTFVVLCEELAEIWYKYHPNTEVQICNQDLTNEGDLAIFRYLNEKPRTWLTSMSYGPGSNAMSPYFRDELRKDLFIYPGQGPINRYLAYTLHSLPLRHTIVHYSDITHWIRSQYEVENPDPYLVRIYGRRTFHQRPKKFYWIFQRIMPFSEGDIIYSEGYHDELHQYLWNRMLWNPNRNLDDLLMEYAVYHFGRDAAPDMVEASLELEKNLETPLLTNPGIRRYYDLVRHAGERIPSNLMATDHRWRAHMQKADLDLYFQLKLQQETELKEQAFSILERGLKKGALKASVEEALHLFQTKPVETEEMKSLIREANDLGEETNRLFGIRNVGYFRRNLDLTGIGWLKSEIERIAESTAEIEGKIRELLYYEDPGEGGFYDDAGTYGKQPHLVEGELPWNPDQFEKMLDPNNRPSANRFVYNLEGPVIFEYRHLDPDSRYKIKVTLVAVRMPAEVAKRYGLTFGKEPLREDILADETIVGKDVEIPVYTARQYEFDVPREVTRDGVLRLKFVSSRPEGTTFQPAVVSEVWVSRVP